MPIRRIGLHLSEALRWSPGHAGDARRALAAGLAMALPTALGLASGAPRAGMAAALGAMMVTGAGQGAAGRRAAGLSVMAAVLGAALVCSDSLPRGLLVPVCGLAALGGGFSRPAAVWAARFVLALMLLSAFAPANDPASPLWPLAVIGGALWTLVLAALMEPPWPAPRDRAPPFAARWRRWRGSLTGFAAWHYPLRLMLGLGPALALQGLWPQRDLHWIALTVALLSERRPGPAWSVKTSQRGLGTALGVLLAGLFLTVTPPAWAIVVGIGLLAASRPVLRARNYLAYSLVMTPLIVLILDAGQPPGPDLLRDRLLATLAGAALVIALNRLFPEPSREERG